MAIESCILSSKKNPNFNSLPAYQRPIILHHGDNNLAIFAGTFIASQLKMLENFTFINALDMSYGMQARCFTQYLASKFDYDPNFMILSMAIMAFSTSSYTDFELSQTLKSDSENSNDAKAIFEIQNTYVEVTWQYLIYRYAYQEVVSRFDKLSRCLLTVPHILTEMKNTRQHQVIIGALIEETNRTLVVDIEK